MRICVRTAAIEQVEFLLHSFMIVSVTRLTTHPEEIGEVDIEANLEDGGDRHVDDDAILGKSKMPHERLA